MYKIHLSLCLILWTGTLVYAQDPFFTHFNGAESHYNPAMTGIKGSRSLGIKYKSQWGTASIVPFQTGLLTYEESLPCMPFDYGLAFAHSQEGDGRLQTSDLGIKVAGGPGMTLGRGLLNLRLGINAQFSQKAVNYSKFVFSDQLDPKYGTVDASGAPNPTSFVPPNEGRSRVFFTPAVGFLFNYISNTKGYRPLAIQLGAALHNAYSLGRPFNGNVYSLLGLEVDIPERYNAFARLDWIALNDRKAYFLSLSPTAFYQRQGELSYWETGLRLGFSRLISAGIFYHNNTAMGTGANTKWMSFNLDIGEVLPDYRGRLDVGTSFSWNQSGLKNFAGPIFELTLTYHWAKSVFCRGSGEGYRYPDKKQPGLPCPNMSFSNDRKRMYENIWYKTLNFRGK